LAIVPLLAIALGLAMDAFSVAVATGLALGKVDRGQSLRMSSSFGLFQFAMPLVGWALGAAVAGYIAAFDHWLAFALLAYVGGRMIWESFGEGDDDVDRDPTRGRELLMLSLATSIDALAVGLSLAFLGVPVLAPAVVIGLVAAAMTMLGLQVGRYAGSRLGPWMERVGGLVLIAIGLRIVLEHTLWQ
jgi:manganese efflux pump family protein